ncbi:GH11585 [Drosophila grimshawi]|uniref:GH11585 n=2 Tax=Drosophila grimshawi TaxID=7222 RepID=B4JBV1_DROGR|nr:GH11585 [Drosophila grimshawi]
MAFDVALACNGYKAKLVKLENCAGPDGIIQLDEDFSVKLNKKCELVPTGCFSNKAFSTAVSKYKVQKDGIVMKEGKMDLCAMMDQAPSEAKDMLKVFGAPSKCPVAEEKICSNDHRVDLTKYKNMLGIARGHLIIDSEIKHDTGKSCFHAEVEIIKN